MSRSSEPPHRLRGRWTRRGQERVSASPDKGDPPGGRLMPASCQYNLKTHMFFLLNMGRVTINSMQVEHYSHAHPGSILYQYMTTVGPDFTLFKVRLSSNI